MSTVRGLGGIVVTKADEIKPGDCLVRGELPGGRKYTVKLKAAKRLGIPTVTGRKFIAILEREGQQT
jgi:hypothetical protein